MTNLFSIHEYRFNAFEKAIKPLTKKGNITYKVVGEEFRTVKKNGEKYLEKLFKVEIEGLVPVIGGWEIVASLEHVNGQNLIHTHIEGVDFGNRDGNWCEHCNKIRRRTMTYILRKDGEIKQVGKSCLKDFTRSSDVEFALKLWNFLAVEIVELQEEDLGELYFIPKYFGVRRVIDSAIECIKKFGYKKTDQEPSTKTEMIEDLRTNYEVRNGEMIDSVINYIGKMDGEFGHNCRVLIGAEGVGSKHFGYIAGAVSVYLKSLEKPESKHVGEEKVRYRDQELKVVRVTSNVSEYTGERYYFITFHNDEGNVLVWKTGSSGGFEFGKSYVVDYTVKGHSEYKGMKQTMISRVSLKG